MKCPIWMISFRGFFIGQKLPVVNIWSDNGETFFSTNFLFLVTSIEKECFFIICGDRWNHFQNVICHAFEIYDIQFPIRVIRYGFIQQSWFMQHLTWLYLKPVPVMYWICSKIDLKRNHKFEIYLYLECSNILTTFISIHMSTC